MRRLLLVALLVAIALISAGTAHATACFGIGVDPGYRAAFDTVRGQANDSQINYPQGRFYREAQTWATPVGADPGHHSEHFHIAACIPNGVTMTGPFDLDLAYTFHNVQDYHIIQASMTAVQGNGNSNSLWTATPAQLADLQAAMDASGNGSVQRVFFSVRTNAPAVNGWKEIRGGIQTMEDGPLAIFHTWHQDSRWYYTDNVAGLPAGPPPPISQNAIRTRAQLSWRKADGTFSDISYHHSGWCGMDGNYIIPGATADTDCASARWTRATISQVWPDTADKRIGLYVTDGGGDAFLMIDPDFHNHYDAPTAACPNVDANGNCLGRWFWVPDNTRHEIFGHQVPVEVVVPASVVASLPAGLHKLVFLSSDAPDCERLGQVCPAGTRGEWSNIEVLPFKVI